MIFTMFHHVSRGDTPLCAGFRNENSKQPKRNGSENRTAGAKSARPRIKSVFERCTQEPCISSLVDKCIDIYIYIYNIYIYYIYICGLSYVIMYVFEDNYSFHVDRYN